MSLALAASAVSVEALWAARQELPTAENGRKTPLWRVITGLEVGKEEELAPGERAAGLRKLVNTAVRVIRNEFRQGPMPAPAAAGAQANAADADAGEALDWVNPNWDPLAQVCHYLGIAQRMLSSLSREVSGYSAQQIADRVRAERLKALIKTEIEAYVKAEVPWLTYDEQTEDIERMQWVLWRRWKEYSGETQSARAQRLGFKYAARYREACFLAFGKTADEVEREALREVAEYFAARVSLEHRWGAVSKDFAYRQWDKYAEKPYTDLWARLLRERREWLVGMKEKWGLEGKLEVEAWVE